MSGLQHRIVKQIVPKTFTVAKPNLPFLLLRFDG
jgi:hypothetical protein